MIRDISIKAVLNGFVVQVGCQTVVFGSVNDMLANISDYVRNPEQVERKYRDLPNAKHTLDGAVEAVAGNRRGMPAAGQDERIAVARQVGELRREYPAECGDSTQGNVPNTGVGASARGW